MPIYEYSCARCAHQFEEIVLGRESQVYCPQCGSDQTHKLMSRCRSRLGGSEPMSEGSSLSAGGGCSGCSGGSCASCG